VRYATDEWEDEAGTLQNQSIDKADSFAQTVSYNLINRSRNPAAPADFLDPLPGPDGRFKWRADESAYDHDRHRWKGTAPLTLAQRIGNMAAHDAAAVRRFASSAGSSSSTALVAVGSASGSAAGSLGGLFVRSAGRVAINGIVNIANASGHLFSYGGLGAPQAQRPLSLDELRMLQYQQMLYDDEREFSTALALMDDRAMQAREDGPLALTDGRADEPPAFPDADPDYDYDPPSLLTTYQNRAPPGAQSKAFPSAPPPKAKAKAKSGNLSRSEREQLRWQHQGFGWTRNPDEQV
jgi:hypothetical protein